MLRFPTLNRINQSRVMTDAFGGLNTNARINSNELSSCLNLSADGYPTLQTRKKRGILETDTEYSATLHTELANYNQPEATIKIPLSGENITISAEGIGTQGVGTRVDDDNISLNIGLGGSAYPFARTLIEDGDIYEKITHLGRPVSVLALVRVEYVGSVAPSHPSEEQFWVDTSDSTNPKMKRYTPNGFVRANPTNTKRMLAMFPVPTSWDSGKKNEILRSAATSIGDFKLKWVEVTEAASVPNKFERSYEKNGTYGTLEAYSLKSDRNCFVFCTSKSQIVKYRKHTNINDYVYRGDVTLTTRGKTTVFELWNHEGRTIYTTSTDLRSQYIKNGWNSRVADFKMNSGIDIVGEDCDVDGNGVVDERDKTALNNEIEAIHTWYANNQPDVSELNTVIGAIKKYIAPPNHYNKAYDLNDDGVLNNDDLTLAQEYLESRRKFSIPERQTVLSGGILYIFPDNKYVNLADLTDYGSLDAEFNTSSFTLSPSLITGENITVTTSSTAPANPSNGDYWLDISGAEKVLKIYSATINAWTGVAAVYTKISATGIGENFNKYDGIKIYKTVGTTQSLVTSAIIYEKTNDYIIVAGILDFSASSITITRKVPLMDFVTASENRLWGCRSGMTLEGENVNEIYASKLGDAKNWSCFMGTSTDSYIASVGSEGAFTGGTIYAGHPIFFKENVIHKVYGNYPSNFQVTTTKARGVQKGSQKSLVVINEILFYKSIDDVCAYDGSLPSSVSEQLNGTKYFEAVAGTVNGKLYIQMKDENGQFHFFSFDTNKRIWHEESIAPIRAFDSYKDKLYYLDTNGVFGVIGNIEDAQEEEDFDWSAEFAPIGYEIADKKYVKRILLKINSQNNVKVYVKYDNDSYVQAYNEEEISDSYAKTRIVPIIPRRCEIMQIKAEGTGEMRIYSLTETVRQGSDR